MKLLKPFYTLVTLMVVSLFLLSCEKAPEEELSLSILAGPTGISVAQILQEQPVYRGYQVVPRIFTAPTEIVPTMVTGNSDVVAIPLNLGAKLSTAKGVDYRLVAITGTGMLQIITRDSAIQDFASIQGKSVYGAGQGGTPEIVYNLLATEKGVITPLDFTYNSPSQLVTALMEGVVDTALLPEPFATLALTKQDLSVAVNMQTLWKEVFSTDETYPMTGIFVSSQLLEEEPKVVKDFLSGLEASIQWVHANPADAGAVTEEWGIMKAAVAQKSIPNLALTYIDGERAKSMTINFFERLLTESPASIGGSLPKDDFYGF